MKLNVNAYCMNKDGEGDCEHVKHEVKSGGILEAGQVVAPLA